MQFVRLRSADAGISDKGLPVLLLYRGEKSVANVLNADNELGGDITTLRVAKLLQEHKML